MDYCSSCRRHLNGALVCPGCGAYAPDIAPPAQRGEPAAATTASTSEPYGAEEFSVWEPSRSAADSDAAPAAESAPAGCPEHTAAPGTGRAARRRQLARWKKSKRRAAAGTAIALVGGGLTIAALPTASSKDRTHAASAPDTTAQESARVSLPALGAEQPDKPATRAPQAKPSATATPGRQTVTVKVPAPATIQPSRTARTAAEEPKSFPSKAPAPQTTAPTVRPTPPATVDPTSGTSGTSGDSGASRPEEQKPTPTQTATTSPTEVCLLVLCLRG
ncbi:hypothetical protein ACIQ7Q_31355 [Streptomyces sp. NPDC096176]|uniref:SCO2400 family protein n=1 Tax=Streptomyces sp. NPDC096176 TaxID=3366079 RepID=UPI0038213166